MYNGKAESLKPDNVTGMQIINDYIENTFPVFKLNLQIKRKLYYDILDTTQRSDGVLHAGR